LLFLQDSVDYLGLTKQEKKNVFKKAASLMRTVSKAIIRNVSAGCFLKHACATTVKMKVFWDIAPRVVSLE
jgi:hypothetical protein